MNESYNNSDALYYKLLAQNTNKEFIDSVNMLVLIDVGIILGVDANGRATVQTTKISDKVPQLLHDVEVIYPGNRKGAFTVDGTGSAGLIFIPRSSMPYVGDLKINVTTPPYTFSNAKILPISSGRSLSVNAGINNAGTFYICTEEYNIQFSIADIIFTNNNTSLKLNNNYIQLQKRGETEYSLQIEDDIFTFSQQVTQYSTEDLSITATNMLNNFNIDAEGNVTYEKYTEDDSDPANPVKDLIQEIKINADGSCSTNMLNKVLTSMDAEGNITFDQQIPVEDDSDEEPTLLNQVKINADGSYTLNTLNQVLTEVTADNNITITQQSYEDDSTTTLNQISITSEGAISMTLGGSETPTTISIGTDGTVSISTGSVALTATDAVSISTDADLSLTASGSLALSGDGGVTIESGSSLDISSSSACSLDVGKYSVSCDSYAVDSGGEISLEGSKLSAIGGDLEVT